MRSATLPRADAAPAVLICLFAVLAVVGGTGAAPRTVPRTHGPNVWSGQWTTNTGGVGFRLVGDQEGIAATSAQGGKPCPAPSDYYRGGYFDPSGGHGGKVTGCTLGDRAHLIGRYVGDPVQDPGSAGDFDIRFSPPDTFAGTFTADSTKTAAKPNGEPAPYTGTFKAHFAGDGCCLSGTLKFDYAMPDRFGLDPNKTGLIDYYTTPAAIRPIHWRVDFSLSGCQATTIYDWKVDGQPATFEAHGPCKFSYNFPKQGKFHVEVDAQPLGKGPTYQSDILVKDFLIIGLGDSVASGEGNPDIPKTADHGVRWDDPRCDRSANSFEARAALAIEKQDPYTSVTFVHLACSGAAIKTGITGPYWGITPGGADLPLESQIGSIKKLVGSREIDAVIISIGANDLGFGPVIGFCVKHTDCPHMTYVNGMTLAQVIEQRLTTVPALYTELSGRLAPLVPPARVYLTQYPDELRGADGNFCPNIINIAGVRAITADEASWMFSSFMTPLNDALALATQTHGWHIVTGQATAFHQHGYCAGPQSWVVSLQESRANQGDSNGTMHPNAEGHQQLAALLLRVLQPDLYPGGKPRPPGVPPQ